MRRPSSETVSLEKRGALTARVDARAGRHARGRKEGGRSVRRAAARAGRRGRRAETRMNGSGGTEKSCPRSQNGSTGLSKRFEDLFAQSDELTKRQLALEGAPRATRAGRRPREKGVVADGLRCARAVRTSTCCARKSRNSTSRTPKSSKLGAELAADRQAIQEFSERMNAISARAPELEAKIDGDTRTR